MQRFFKLFNIVVEDKSDEEKRLISIVQRIEINLDDAEKVGQLVACPGTAIMLIINDVFLTFLKQQLFVNNVNSMSVNIVAALNGVFNDNVFRFVNGYVEYLPKQWSKEI